MKNALISILALTLLVSSCIKGSVSPEEAKAMVARGARVIDVRTPEEFAGGGIPGAVNVPFEQLSMRLAELGPRDREIIVYCEAGVRSARAASLLREKGFTRVYDLGAMSRWR
jgi:rhodanese-related sulfurtransferase